VNYIHLIELGCFSPPGARLYAPLCDISLGLHISQKPYRNRNRVGDPGRLYGPVRVTVRTRNRIPLTVTVGIPTFYSFRTRLGGRKKPDRTVG
jgi:hypothetical protein